MRQKFAGILNVFQKFLTKYGRNPAKRWALNTIVDAPYEGSKLCIKNLKSSCQLCFLSCSV